MRGLVGDLLDAGRIESRTLSVAPEATPVERARNAFVAGGRRRAGPDDEFRTGLPDTDSGNAGARGVSGPERPSGVRKSSVSQIHPIASDDPLR